MVDMAIVTTPTPSPPPPLVIGLVGATVDSVDALDTLALQAVAGYRSAHTRRIYAAKIRAYGHWLRTNDMGMRTLSRESVGMWVQTIKDAGARRPVVNQCVKAVRALVKEARIRRIVTRDLAEELIGADGVKLERELGRRAGNWLGIEDARRLMQLPDRSTVVGKRDAVMLGLLLGCGLRREEASDLRWGSVQQRDGRMVLVDIESKGGRVRSVPVPRWAANDVDTWRQSLPEPLTASAGVRVLAAMHNRYGRVSWHEGLGVNGIWYLVQEYAKQLSVHVTPHDLRRTVAQLMRRAGAEVEQISVVLGHSSIVVTMRYLGVEMEMGAGAAAVDQVRWTRDE